MSKLSRFNLLFITVAVITLLGSMSGVALMQRQAPAKPSPTPVTPVDINGKIIPAGEKYVAQRVTKDGKVIAYRQNQREIEALVKGLKEDGVTDKKLLDTKYWLAAACQLSGPKKCYGVCPASPLSLTCKFIYFDGSNIYSKVGSGTMPIVRNDGYCGCLSEG
jgi:hypothetical protein